MSDDLEHSVHNAVLSAFEACLEAQLRAIRTLKQEPATPASSKELSRSHPDMTYDILRETGHPLHITSLIEHIRLRFDITVDRESLVSSLTKMEKKCPTTIPARPDRHPEKGNRGKSRASRSV